MSSPCPLSCPSPACTSRAIHERAVYDQQLAPDCERNRCSPGRCRNLLDIVYVCLLYNPAQQLYRRTEPYVVICMTHIGTRMGVEVSVLITDDEMVIFAVCALVCHYFKNLMVFSLISRYSCNCQKDNTFLVRTKSR